MGVIRPSIRQVGINGTKYLEFAGPPVGQPAEFPAHSGDPPTQALAKSC